MSPTTTKMHGLEHDTLLVVTYPVRVRGASDEHPLLGPGVMPGPNYFRC
jgi:hypothetical protein